MSAGPIRVGDRDRERVAERLAAHAAAGRLTVEELEERVARAHGAVTERDLAVLEQDLPGPGRAVTAAASPRALAPRGVAAAAAAAALVAVLIAALVLPIVLLGHPIAPPLFAVALWLLVKRRARRAFWAPSGW